MQYFAYELGKIVRDQQLEEARRARLARSVRQTRHRRFAWLERLQVRLFPVKEETAARCVPCPSPSL